MKIRIHFKSKDVPSFLINRYGREPAEVSSADVNEGVLLILDKTGRTAINMSVIVAIENPEA